MKTTAGGRCSKKPRTWAGSPCHSLRVRALACLAVFWPIAHGLSATAEPADAPIGSTGGDQIVWAYRHVAAAEGGPAAWRFVFLLPDTDPRVGWSRPFGWGEIAGEIGLTAVRGRHLHVIFADGTHRVYTPDRSTIGLKLPRPVVPVALAGDEQADALFAVVPRHVAASLLAGESDLETELPAVRSNEPDTSDKPTAPPGDERPARGDEALPSRTRWPDAHYVLMRFADAQWHADRPLPAWFDQREDIHLTAQAGAVELICRDPGDGPGWVHARSSSPAADWSEPRAIDALSTGDPVGFFSVKGRPVLIQATTGPDATSCRPVRFDGDAWVPGQPFSEIGGASGAASIGVHFAALGDRIVTTWVGDDGTASWAAWPVDGGRPIVARQPIGPLVGGATVAPGTGAVQTIIAYAVLAIIMLTVFVRRKQTVFRPIVLPPGYRLARFGPRLYAFLIDGILFLPACAYGFAQPIRRFHFDQALLWQAAVNDPAFASELMWRWAAVVAGFVVYATVFESVWGATPGKRLLRCRVLNERGGPCGLVRALVRNAVRSLEISLVTLLWTVMLILLTRNRQRLGDLLGGTIVVEFDAAAGGPPPPIGNSG
ncbi:MAG: RDD family protein [Phycisphaerales bacterium]|nr:RDD family protein [Phycisphaerales bacterium]